MRVSVFARISTSTIEPSAIALIDFKTALREAMEGVQVPATWIRSEDEVKKIQAAQEQAAAAQQMLASMEQASVVNKNNAAAQAQAPAEAPPAGGAPLDMMAA